MILSQVSPIAYSPVQPAQPDNVEFPYNVQQLAEAICLSTRRSRVFIRENFALGADYDVIGGNHKMILSAECFAVAVALQYKYGRFNYLIKREAIPHYSLYRDRIEAAVAQRNFKKMQRRQIRNRSDRYEQLSFDFSAC